MGADTYVKQQRHDLQKTDLAERAGELERDPADGTPDVHGTQGRTF